MLKIDSDFQKNFISFLSSNVSKNKNYLYNTNKFHNTYL